MAGATRTSCEPGRVTVTRSPVSSVTVAGLAVPSDAAFPLTPVLVLVPVLDAPGPAHVAWPEPSISPATSIAIENFRRALNPVPPVRRLTRME
ncbi:hypothetical protein GCM10023322_09910 [Rugosimonospora acidiphila]|uniref:Uncharacterized protein n=1 Tax=Rugosimonospora acidiphila TaxID=556531 RepID=A0ABP9RKK9_9ACTN